MGDLQKLSLIIFSVMGVIIIGVFLFTYLSSVSKGTTSEHAVPKANQKRLIFFIILATCAAILGTATMQKSPYFLYAKEQPASVIHVQSSQYSFVLSNEPITATTDLSKIPDPVLTKDQLVEFQVTSTDVNHGFAIYNSKKEIVAQTQAMPGYVNRLRWKFNEPGEYKILCLEFCGARHHNMRASFLVK